MKRSGFKNKGNKLKPIGARAKRMRQGKIAPNKQEAKWMSDIAAFGCIVCRLQFGVYKEAAVHHPLAGGRRLGHMYSIPLCDPGHHQNAPPGGLFISRHPDKTRFESAYGTEEELLQKIKELL